MEALELSDDFLCIPYTTEIRPVSGFPANPNPTLIWSGWPKAYSKILADCAQNVGCKFIVR
jgi:hypothetical protein